MNVCRAEGNTRINVEVVMDYLRYLGPQVIFYSKLIKTNRKRRPFQYKQQLDSKKPFNYEISIYLIKKREY